MSASRVTSDMATSVDGYVPPVIQDSKLERRSMRYELNDYEWRVIKPMLPNKWRDFFKLERRDNRQRRGRTFPTSSVQDGPVPLGGDGNLWK